MAVTGTWEVIAAPAPVVVLPPRSHPWGTAYCIPAATSERRRRTNSKNRPGERKGLFTDTHGSVVGTPSRPIPRATPPEVRNAATEAWGSFYGKPGVVRFAGSKFQGKKSSLRVTWSECEPSQGGG